MIDRYINLLIDRGIIWQGEEEIYKYKLTCFLGKNIYDKYNDIDKSDFQTDHQYCYVYRIFFLAEKQKGGFHLDSLRVALYAP